MKWVWSDRRLFLALVAIGVLTFLGFWAKMEVAGPIATVVMAVAASNHMDKRVQAGRLPNVD